jgi:hypothetical protein
MPKDHWKRARNQRVARQVKYELATGQELSFEFARDEITPLDQINVFEEAKRPGDPDATEPTPARVPPTPNRSVARSKAPSNVRFPLARGVSVLVKIDHRSKLSVVEALELALKEARTRIELGLKTPAQTTKPATAPKTKAPKPLAKAVVDEPGIAVLRSKLRNLAHDANARGLLVPSWKQKQLRPWVLRVDSAQGPSKLARLMRELEGNVVYADKYVGQRKAGRNVWKIRCATAKTFDEVSKLFSELEAWSNHGWR